MSEQVLIQKMRDWPGVMTEENSTDEAIESMERHVASYVSLSPHRLNCLDLCRRIRELDAQKKDIQDVRDDLRERYTTLITELRDLKQHELLIDAGTMGLMNPVKAVLVADITALLEKQDG
jgi:hypothetical protein